MTGRHIFSSQRGAALLIILALMLMAGLTYLVNNIEGEIGVRRQQKTEKMLALAREALISWSVTNEVPGRMPCPEDLDSIGTSREGQAMPSCSNSEVLIGRLPWRTLKTGPLFDGYGEPLWYVLSPGFRLEPINPKTDAKLYLNDLDEIVAIVISPGPPLPNQSRVRVRPSHNDYIESQDHTKPKHFVTPPHNNSVTNDQLLAIKKSSLVAAIFQRVAAEIRGDPNNGLARYYAKYGKLPHPASSPPPNATQGTSSSGYIPYDDPDIFYPSSGWLRSNQWFDFINYHRENNKTARLELPQLTLTRIFKFP